MAIHVVLVDSVIERLRKKGLFVSIKKSVLHASEVKYLGHHVPNKDILSRRWDHALGEGGKAHQDLEIRLAQPGQLVMGSVQDPIVMINSASPQIQSTSPQRRLFTTSTGSQ